MGVKVLVTSFKGANTATDYANSRYVMDVEGFVTDGASFDQAFGGGNILVHIPFSMSSQKADAAIRQAIVTAVSSIWSLTVDPDDDIYIPFAVR